MESSNLRRVLIYDQFFFLTRRKIYPANEKKKDYLHKFHLDTYLLNFFIWYI